MKSCFLIGHADAPEEVYPVLLKEIERHITELEVEYFLVGHYGQFDAMAARALRELKGKYPHVIAMLLLPYHPAERPMETPEGFDGTYYPEQMERVPRAVCIVEANRRAVKASDHVIAYVQHNIGNSSAIVNYALRSDRITVTLLSNVK